MDPDARLDLLRIAGLLMERIPFRFVRFSDGELGVLRNESLVISASHLSWRGGVTRHSLPSYDYKSFDPQTGQALREDLLAAAMHRSVRYFKGVPSAHNTAIEDRQFMEEINGGLDPYLTFSDLLMNSNYRPFLKVILPILAERTDVHVIGNFRMRPELIDPAWRLIAVPDDFFSDYQPVKKSVLSEVQNIPENSLVLSSASSLSNVVGHVVDINRSDLTFIDIGTTLHGRMGLDPATRDYHVEGLNWNLRTVVPKIRYRRARHYRIRW
jgi:hypothetical protein